MPGSRRRRGKSTCDRPSWAPPRSSPVLAATRPPCGGGERPRRCRRSRRAPTGRWLLSMLRRGRARIALVGAVISVALKLRSRLSLSAALARLASRASRAVGVAGGDGLLHGGEVSIATIDRRSVRLNHAVLANAFAATFSHPHAFGRPQSVADVIGAIVCRVVRRVTSRLFFSNISSLRASIHRETRVPITLLIKFEGDRERERERETR